MPDNETPERVSDLERRVAQLEGLLGVRNWRPTPGFDPVRFQRVLQGYLLRITLPLFLPLMLLPMLLPVLLPRLPEATMPASLWHPAVPQMGAGGIGLISLGGLAVGVLAIGGCAVGVVAVGGGALGIVAVGGGAVGLVAIGGGAVGYIAIGGGAAGRYVLAGQGRGRHVFDIRRQDPEAVWFFVRYFPRLREAFVGTAAQ